MSTDEMFQQATRLKLRFNTSQGQLTVEDLWDIPLTSTRNASLDSIAIDLHIQAKGASDIVSFVTPPNAQIDAAKSALSLKFEIVKHIIGVRVTERDLAKDLADRRARKTRLLSLIAQKEDQALGEKSLDELRAEVAALAESL